MRNAVVLALLATAAPLFAQSSVTPHAIVSIRGVNASGPAPWMAGGFGRMAAGGDENELFANVRAGLDWSPVHWLNVHVSGVARREPEEYGGDRAGLIEAYADANFTSGREQLRLRAGHFFLPTSRENRGELWSSPYALSFSALNTWIGEEFRPTGAELEWKHLASRGFVTAAAGAFRGNDTSGTLLAWRGWAVGDRLSAYGETVPLPPLRSLDEVFLRQRRGTQPFGRDLDGRTGYTARVRWAQPGVMTAQAAYVDNQGDRALYDDQYSWDTRFAIVGADFGSLDRTSVATEYLKGSTVMGDPARAFVDADFDAFYVLVSHKLGRNRFTARYDRFGTEENDFSIAESNDEDGRSWTLAWLYDVNRSFRTGVEFTQVTGRRDALAQQALDPAFDGRAVTVDLTWSY
jgi:hypothetical protein